MTATNEQGERKVGRPRSQQSQQAILVAALEVLTDVGYEAMSIEQVAGQAGVGKTTIYRWWPSKEDLTIDAIKTLHVDVPIVDTGDIRNDAIVIMQHGFQIWNSHQRLIFRLIGEMHTRPELFQMLHSRLLEPRFQLLIQRLKRAQTQGELRTDIDAVDMLGIIAGPFWYRSMFLNPAPSVSREDVERFVDIILQGLVSR
jgi:AcrR family transcriptional regulator